MTPQRPPLAPWYSMVPTGSSGGGHVPKSAPQTIIRLLFPVIVALLPRVRNSRWGKGSKPFSQTQNISMKMPSKHRIIVSFFRHRPRGEGAGLIPPSQQYFVQNLFKFKLDAMTVRAALATTIFILLMFSIVLVHQWEPRSTVRPDPRDDTPTPPPLAPW